MHSITRDGRGKFVPVVRPKRWNASSVVRSRERSDRIATARMERKKRLATTQLLEELDRRAIAELEANRHPVGSRPAAGSTRSILVRLS